MRVVVVGASGNAGSEVVEEARRRGHDVVGVSRHAPDTVADGVTWREADATDPAALAPIVDGADAVVVALRASWPGSEPDSFAAVLRGLADVVGPARLSVVGGASSLLVDGVRIFDLPGFPEEYKTEARGSANGLEYLRGTGPELDWTYLSPAPELTVGPRTGRYVSGVDSPVGESISFADYAIALVDELEKRDHVRSRWTVASG